MDEEQGGTKPGHGLGQSKAMSKVPIDLRVSGAGGLVKLSPVDTVPDAQDLEAWSRALPDWSRNPDIYGSIVDTGDGSARQNARHDVSPDTLRALYGLIWRLNCFTKPAVGLMPGATSAWAFALAHAGTHRAAGADFQVKIPAPDNAATKCAPMYGLAHALAEMPFALGPYLALTGIPLRRADAYALGLMTHCIDVDAFPAIAAGICGADPVDPLLDDRHAEPAAGAVMTNRTWIERCFSAKSITEILDRLGRETDPGALAARASLAGQPPLALDARLALVRRAASVDLRAALIDDFAACTPAGTPPLELISRDALQAPQT